MVFQRQTICLLRYEYNEVLTSDLLTQLSNFGISPFSTMPEQTAVFFHDNVSIVSWKWVELNKRAEEASDMENSKTQTGR